MTDWQAQFYGNTARLIYGINVLDGLRMLEPQSVQCIVTSPPYWGLRNYNTNPQLWPPLSVAAGPVPADCDHDWQTTDPRRRRSTNDVVNLNSKQATSVGTLHDLIPANVCSKCNCWQGELGQEPTPELFIEHLTLIFRECHRVLRNDGTLWINIGDTYHGSWGAVSHDIETKAKRTGSTERPPTSRHIDGLKPKDLVGIPWMLAFALRKDGWYLRQENIWAKPNCMPESVTDRTTRSHESVFHLTKQKDYYYDHEAVKTPPKDPEDDLRRIAQARADDKRSSNDDNVARIRKSEKQRGHSRRHDGFNDRWDDMTKEEQQQNGANLRSVWWITPAQYRESHYATFPPTLPETCILAGSKIGDTILDPFMGSGTTAQAALTNNRHVIGIDLDPKNLDMAIRRIKKAVARDERTVALF